MKIKEVITPAMSESINWIQAAQILGMSDWTAGRWNERGYDGLYDRLARRPSPKGVPLAEADSTAGHFERTNGKNKRCTKPIRPLIRVESSDCIWVPARTEHKFTTVEKTKALFSRYSSLGRFRIRFNFGQLIGLLPIVATAEKLFQPDISHNEEIAAAHFGQLQFWSTGPTISPCNGHCRPGVTTNDGFQWKFHCEIEMWR